MLVKLIVSFVLAVATFVLTRTASYAVYVFLLAAACCYLVLTIVSERALTTVERRLALPQ